MNNPCLERYNDPFGMVKLQLLRHTSVRNPITGVDGHLYFKTDNFHYRVVNLDNDGYELLEFTPNHNAPSTMNYELLVDNWHGIIEYIKAA